MTSTATAQTTQVYELYIRATPEQIWAAITEPDLTERYFFGSRITVTSERRVSLAPDGASSWGDTETLAWDPPRRLVHGWKSLYDPELADEPESRVTWEIEPQDGGYSKLTVVHDRLENSPKTAESVRGWTLVLSNLKTFLETGKALGD
jgi:uncharacterized protein YndB with AHSA1/START domain